ncbi:MAG TPA: hypothetical protein DDZ88_08470 [Verrucomicrobiales bacterium]|nr:hypothetical protein [Verrucomicrobiales bacterium]
MFQLFASDRPASNLRQPRIQYRVDDPAMSSLEELRRFAGHRRLGALYLEALKLGAELILRRAVEEGLWQRGGVPMGLSPVKALPVKSPRPAPVKTERTAPVEARPEAPPPVVADPVAVVEPVVSGPPPVLVEPAPAAPERTLAIPSVPDTPMPPPRRATYSAAAEAQFAQFGD